VIVIDASSLAKYIIKEEGWAGVEKHLVNNQVYTLDLAVKEVLNVIWKYSVIFRALSPNIAMEKYSILTNLIENKIVSIDDEKRYLKEAFNIALKMKLTIYDALYIAQAIKLNAKLLTSDEDQARVARNLGLRVIFI